MNIPELTHDEFDELVKEMGEWGALATEPDLLTADYGDVEDVVDGNENVMGMRTVYMQVQEPHLYTTREGKVMIVLPPEDATTYDMVNSFYPRAESAGDPWLYRIVPYIGASWEMTKFMFRDGADYEDGQRKIAPFDISKPETH